MTIRLVGAIFACLFLSVPVLGQSTVATNASTPTVAATNAVAVPGARLQGDWKKVQAQPLLAMGRVAFDMTAKKLSFSWQGRGEVVWSIVAFAEDSEADMPRYTLTLTGPTGRMTVTVLCFSENTIYIGQAPSGGISIWGAYNRAN